MRQTFDKAIKFVLKWEGGYTNDPNDPGGETKYGISKRAYPNLNIKALTESDAIAIFKRDYWDKANCDNLPYPLDFVVFDTAVNCGVSRALNWSKSGDYKDVLLLRLAHYSHLAAKENFRTFLRGWINRLVALYKEITVGV